MRFGKSASVLTLLPVAVSFPVDRSRLKVRICDFGNPRAPKYRCVPDESVSMPMGPSGVEMGEPGNAVKLPPAVENS